MKGVGVMENKKMKLWKKILIAIFIILLLLVILTLRKFIIITNIEKVAKVPASKTNYMVELHTLQNNSVSIMKGYYRDGNFLNMLKTNVDNSLEMRSLTLYKKGKDGVSVVQTGDQKYAFVNEDVLGNVQVVTFAGLLYDKTMVMHKLGLSILSSIKSEKCNGKDCYFIQMPGGWRMWVDKETGTIIREIDGGGMVTDRKYSFDVVKDEDIARPNFSDCIVKTE